MRIRVRGFENRFSTLGILAAGLLFACVAFGQEDPPQQAPPPPGGGMMQMPGGAGPMMPGRGMMRGMPGTGMMQMRQARPGMGDGPGMRRMGQMGPGEPMAGLLRNPEVQKELGLTPEQLQKLDDIRFNAEKEGIQHRSALQISHLELNHLMTAENPDRAAIDKKIQETAQEEAAMMRSSINARLNARSVLTAEQRTKLKQYMQNRMTPGGPLGAGTGRPGRPARKAAPAGEKAPTPEAPAKRPAE